jgi:hypothetical protein
VALLRSGNYTSCLTAAAAAAVGHTSANRSRCVPVCPLHDSLAALQSGNYTPCLTDATAAAAQDTPLQAGQDVYLLAPSITRWQWHPFTVATVEEPAAATTAAGLTKDASPDSKDVANATGPVHKLARLCIKAAGSWTQVCAAITGSWLEL